MGKAFECCQQFSLTSGVTSNSDLPPPKSSILGWVRLGCAFWTVASVL